MPQRSLALGQQLAVNAITATLGQSGGVFAVNGPPGTGKTTLLRDLIAAIVVDRAGALSGLAHPTDAFVASGEYHWKVGDYRRTVQRWQPGLVGHEVVVASSNNGAVENVTNEIPSRGSVDEVWLDQIDHFAAVATRMLNPERKRRRTQGERPAWGLIAARLGNMSNRASGSTTSGSTASIPTALRTQGSRRSSRLGRLTRRPSTGPRRWPPSAQHSQRRRLRSTSGGCATGRWSPSAPQSGASARRRTEHERLTPPGGLLSMIRPTVRA